MDQESDFLYFEAYIRPEISKLSRARLVQIRGRLSAWPRGRLSAGKHVGAYVLEHVGACVLENAGANYCSGPSMKAGIDPIDKHSLFIKGREFKL